MGRWWLVFAAGLVVAGLLVGPASADEPPDDLALAERYAPVLYFHPEEIFRPQPVEVMVGQARLRQVRSILFGVNVLNQLSVRDLFMYHGAEYYLDAWYGDEGISDYKNYSAHRAHYLSSLSPEAGGLPVTTYAHVVREAERTTIQYWLFYYYNDWLNKHEGDWEVVQVVLDQAEQPQWVVLSQHHGGTRRPWSAVQVEDRTYPAVFVALGSHANYFVGDEVYPNERVIGSGSFVVMDRTGQVGRVVPQVLLLPDPAAIDADPQAWPDMGWVGFEGSWGERAAQADFGGPSGPAQKGIQWDDPYLWGMEQPLDHESWYRHRLRVTVEALGVVEVALLTADGRPAASVERIEEPEDGRVTLLLHRDPLPGERFDFSVVAAEGARAAMTTVFPLVDQERVETVVYEQVALPPGGSLTGRLCAPCDPGLEWANDGGDPVDVLFHVESAAAVWDAPDVVWLAGLLPASEVASGLGQALLAGLLPPVLYVLALYGVDRFEKEPKRLLAATFFWGAAPALLLAVAVRVFFNLPPSLLGPEAVQAVGAGFVAPLVEELLKGGAVLFIYLRYREEFDGVLDGVIYGGMVGFGFAMSGNTISYVGAFLLHGWAGLSAPVLLQGVLYGLDHALYTAAFGAGLGLARAWDIRRPRWLAGLGGFLVAVVSHSVHNLVVREVLGLSVFTVFLTWIGLGAMGSVVVWALIHQRRVLREELTGEVSDQLYRAMTMPGGRARAQWRSLLRGGVRGLRRERRLHQRCAELAFKKRQARLHPEESRLGDLVDRLRRELSTAE